MKLQIDADGVLVSNLFATKRISWVELKAVEVRRRWKIWQTWDSGIPGLGFVLKDGSVMVADGSINLNDRERADLLAVLRPYSSRYGFSMTFANESLTRA